MRFLKEPVVQFLLLGGLLFAAWFLFAPAEELPPERIVVDAAVVASLQESFAAVWKRPPSAAETEGLVEDFLAEEVLYREAQKLGLDRNDVVIRRRLRQKMEFLLQDGLALTPVDEPALRAFFEAEQARYLDPDRLSFRQVFLGPESNSEGANLLVRLNGSDPPDPSEVGRGSLLPQEMRAASAAQVDRSFGRDFAARLQALPPGLWAGPVESAYGWHLVRLDGVEAGGLPDFETVRPLVERDFRAAQQKKAQAELVERLKQNYEIVFEESRP